MTLPAHAHLVCEAVQGASFLHPYNKQQLHTPHTAGTMKVHTAALPHAHLICEAVQGASFLHPYNKQQLHTPHTAGTMRVHTAALPHAHLVGEAVQGAGEAIQTRGERQVGVRKCRAHQVGGVGRDVATLHRK